MKQKLCPRGLNASALKTIAILAMLVDHVAYVFVDEYYSPLGVLLHFIGRITGPVMFFFVAEGYHKTKNVGRYMLRMALFAALSYLPFIYMPTGALPTAANFLDLNVIYTLFLGLVSLWVLHNVKQPVLKWLLILGLLLLSTYGDWGYTAVLMILIFDLFRESFRYQCLAYSIVVACEVLPSLLRALPLALGGAPFAQYAGSLGYVVVQLGMFVPLLLLGLYNGKRGGMNKWFFYIFYPAHMVVIGFLYQLSLGNIL